MTAGSKYRPDIDGLRAVAVLSVVLYHADFKAFSGGYVGVDVFFVISGFLITRLVYDAAQSRTFSYSAFYLRRARRLFPAAFFTLVLSSGLAISLMAEEHLAKFGASLGYASFALSNFYFWGQSGYFETDANLEPLLHTWSLAVEEQFYLIWPAFVVLLAGWPRRRGLGVLLAVCAFGFTAAVCVIIVDTQAAFFLTPARVWEFALGGLVVWAAPARLPGYAREALTLAGLGMIGWSVFSYDTETLFPGPAAALPCVGAALTILAGDAQYSGSLLRNPVSVFIGKTSYSFYLIHWPAIVFYKYYAFTELSRVDAAGLVLLSFAAGCVMWRYVEEPFRHPQPGRRVLSPAGFFATCAGCSVATALLAAQLWRSGGFDRPSQAANRAVVRYLKQQNNSIGTLTRAGTCYTLYREPFDPGACLVTAADKPNFLVFGDSYAAAAFSGMVRHFGPRAQLSLAAHAGCRPILEPTTPRPACAQQIGHVFNRLDLSRFDAVFLIGSFKGERSAEEIKQATTRLHARGARRIVVVGGPHSYTASVTATFTALARFAPAKIFDRLSSLVEPLSLEMDRQLAQADLGPAVYVSMLEITCPARRTAACMHTLPGTQLPFISDTNHLTPDGAAWVFDQLSARDVPWNELVPAQRAADAAPPSVTGERAAAP